MGSSLQFLEFTTDDKKKIQKEFDEAVEESLMEDGHSYSGEIGMLGRSNIKWKVKVHDTLGEAEVYLSEHHYKGLPAWGVPYYLPSTRKLPEKKIAKLKERISKTEVARFNLLDKATKKFYAAQSQTVTCKNCGSRLSRAHLKGSNLYGSDDAPPYCPLIGCRINKQMVCLFSRTVQNRLARLLEKEDELKTEIVILSTRVPSDKIGYIVGGWCAS